MKLMKSHNPEKKWDAVFNDGKIVSFGASGYDDYTLTGDKAQRDRYRMRHRKDLKGDVRSPGYLSYYILWGDSTDMQKNLRDYKRRFDID